MESSRILLVDDEELILHLMSVALTRDGFTQIETVTTGVDAISRCRAWQPDIIILDVMLPDIDGFEVCHQIRSFTSVPILFLTAKTSDLDKLTGFCQGGDDYVTKPFNPLEVVARVRVHLRKQHQNMGQELSEKQVFDMGRFQVNEVSAELIVDGVTVACPAREFQLILFLCKNPNRVFSRSQLYEQVWGEPSLGDDTTVIVHISRLRERIEIDPSKPAYLLTVRGLGYKLLAHNPAVSKQ